MSKVSKSPGRLTFQKEKYVERREAEGKLPDPAYLEMFAEDLKRYNKRFDDPQSHVNNLEFELLTTDWILDKVRTSESYAQNLYAAMCNNGFISLDVIAVLKGEEWSCSWRYAGGIIADMRQEGDYIDWYCSGIPNGDFPDAIDIPYEQKKFVPEGRITDEIRNDLQRLGWATAPGGDWEKFEQGDK